jgi:hypothetical protein
LKHVKNIASQAWSGQVIDRPDHIRFGRAIWSATGASTATRGSRYCGGRGPIAARALWFTLTCLLVFTLVDSGCHQAVPRRESVPVRENVPVNTGLSGFFEDTAGAKSDLLAKSRTYDLRAPGQRDSLHAAIKRQREMWRASGVRDYHFLLRASCFCPDQEGWVLLEIRGGQAVRVWNRGGKPVPLTERNNYNIDGLFDLLDQKADHDDVVEVSFEGRWHYPANIRTDVRVGLPDDWGILEARGFRPR